MLLCEAAGFDVILVETVGVGQSETAVADLTDCFVVLMLPGAGDELQGIKKGILELADIIAVNKADDAQARERRCRRVSGRAAHPHARLGGLDPAGADGLGPDGARPRRPLGQVLEHRARLEASGELQAKRRAQDTKWMWALVHERLHERLTRIPPCAVACRRSSGRSPKERCPRLPERTRSWPCWRFRRETVIRPAPPLPLGTLRAAAGPVESRITSTIAFLRELYEGDTLRAHRFRYASSSIFSRSCSSFSFLPPIRVVEAMDVIMGLAIAADLAARLAISRRRMRDLMHPATWADVIAIASFSLPSPERERASCALSEP